MVKSSIIQKKLNPKTMQLMQSNSNPIQRNPTQSNAIQRNSMQSTENNHGIRVLRFEFSKGITDALKAFTEVHRYDDRKTYKEAWAAWLAHNEIAAMLKAEVERLTVLGYKGDVTDKLFKSGRYYFRQKTCGFPNLSLHADTKLLGVRDVPIALVAPRKYVLLNRDLLSAMDDHIERGLRQSDFRPASGFADFCKLNVDYYRSEVTRLSEIMPTGEAVGDKIKKTYKNRYFMLVKANAFAVA